MAFFQGTFANFQACKLMETKHKKQIHIHGPAGDMGSVDVMFFVGPYQL